MNHALLCATVLVMLGCLAPALVASSVGSNSFSAHNSAPLIQTLIKHEKTRPHSTQDFPDGYWFGTPSLLCVMGMTGSPSSSGRKRRDVFGTRSRYALRFSHRLMYYRGTLYEWGTGTLGYFIGVSPSVVECEITWEEMPTGNSTCSAQTIKAFTYNYRSQYGVYNIATNNCHHYANRVVQLLSSPNCEAAPGHWTRMAQTFWRYLGGLLDGGTQEVVQLDNANDHHDRETIH